MFENFNSEKFWITEMWIPQIGGTELMVEIYFFVCSFHNIFKLDTNYVPIPA